MIIDHASSILGSMMAGASRIPSDAPMVRTIDIPQVFYNLPVDSIIYLRIDFNAEGVRSGDYLVDIDLYLRDQIIPDIILPVRIHVRDAPSISVLSDTVSFGQVYMHTLSSKEVKVQNNGTETLRIDRVCTDLDESRITPSSASIEPGECRIFEMELYTREQQEFASNLSFYTNDPTDPLISIPVTGWSIKPPNLRLDDLYRDKVRANADKIVFWKGIKSNVPYDLYLTYSVITYKYPFECHDRMLQPDSSGWMSTTLPDSCTLAPGEILPFSVTLNPAGLSSGDHYAELIIHAFNPAYIHTKYVIMIHLLVIGMQEWEIHADNKVLLFPNPTSGTLTIQTESPGIKAVVITSLNGQVLLKTVIDGSSAEIDISSLEQGIYFITIQSDKTVTTRRIIKH
jgi:hypothetical protein